MFRVLQKIVDWHVVVFSCFLTDAIALSQLPTNEAVFKGNKTQMNCKTDPHLNIYWIGNKEGESELRKLSRGKIVNPVYNSSYEINSTQPGQFDLIVNSGMADTAIEYICEEPENDEKQSAQLAIIERNDLECRIQTITDATNRHAYNLTCKIVVYGNWLPRLKWYKNNEQVDVFDTERRPGSIKATLIAYPSANITEYRCEMRFEVSDKPRETTATNVPTLHLSWSEWLPNGSEEFKTQPTSTTDYNPIDNGAMVTRAALAGIITGIIIIIIIIIVVTGVICRKKKISQCYRHVQIPSNHKIDYDTDHNMILMVNPPTSEK